MKILIFGLPGSGKTYLAERLQKHLNCSWFNADKIRYMANDWEFTEDARIRQARRMMNIADFEKAQDHTVICDFVCPTQITRYIFNADFTIWMDTVPCSRFEDTNSIFETPSYADLVIEKFMTDDEILHVVNKISGVYT
jgi:adenylylsulfate kinase